LDKALKNIGRVGKVKNAYLLKPRVYQQLAGSLACENRSSSKSEKRVQFLPAKIAIRKTGNAWSKLLL
jgi:hypothetical protein